MSAAQKICVLERRAEGRFSLIGSGVVIGERLVLTALHNVRELDEDALFVRTQPEAEPAQVTRVHPSDDPEVDAAVLEVARPLGVKPASIDGREIDVHEPFSAWGFPEVREDKPSEDAEPFRGRTHLAERGAKTLHLDVSLPPGSWPGASGAGVCVRRRVVAVVRGAHDGWNNGRITATPVSCFADAGWFLDALGDAQHRREYADAVTELHHEIVLSLRPHRALCKELRERLALEHAEPTQLADALIGAPADQLVRTLEQTARELEQGDRAAAAVEAALDVLFRVLPYAVDWKQSILDAQAARSLGDRDGAKGYELHLMHASLAEVVLAGLEGREARFMPLRGGKVLAGVGMLLWPASDAAALRRTEDTLLDGVLLKLEHKLDSPGAARVMTELAEELEVGLVTNPTFNVRAVRTALANELERSLGDGTAMRRSLVVMDVDFDGPEHGLKAWGVARRALGEALPSLRLIHLAGDPDDADDAEFSMDDKLKHLYRWKLKLQEGS